MPDAYFEPSYLFTVIDPPNPGMPYLSVAIAPDGAVTGMAFWDAAAAQKFLEEVAAAVAKPPLEDNG